MASHAFKRFPPHPRPSPRAPPSSDRHPVPAPRHPPPARTSLFRPKIPTLAEAMRNRHRDALRDIDALVRASSAAADLATTNAQNAYTIANDMLSRYAGMPAVTPQQAAASEAAWQAAMAAGKAMVKANEASACAMNLHVMAMRTETMQAEATVKVLTARINQGAVALHGMAVARQGARCYPGAGPAP